MEKLLVVRSRAVIIMLLIKIRRPKHKGKIRIRSILWESVWGDRQSLAPWKLGFLAIFQVRISKNWEWRRERNDETNRESTVWGEIYVTVDFARRRKLIPRNFSVYLNWGRTYTRYDFLSNCLVFLLYYMRRKFISVSYVRVVALTYIVSFRSFNRVTPIFFGMNLWTFRHSSREYDIGSKRKKEGDRRRKREKYYFYVA